MTMAEQRAPSSSNLTLIWSSYRKMAPIRPGRSKFSSPPISSPDTSSIATWHGTLFALTPELLEVARAADAVCFGTLPQRHEVSRSTIQSFVEATAPECARVCDVNLRMPDCTPEVLHWSMAHATIIKLSDEEMPQVFSLLNDWVGQHWCRRVLKARPMRCLKNFPACQLVATTLGPHGCLLTTRESTFGHPGFPIKVVDTVGAGDAFTAGLIHAYLRGASLHRWRRSAIFAAATWPRSQELLRRCLQI